LLKPTKNATGFGTILLRIVFVGVLCVGAIYGWSVYRGKKTDLPRFTLLDSLKGTNDARNQPATNPPAQPKVEPELPQNLVAPPTNTIAKPTNPPPELEHQPRLVRNVQNTLDAQIALARKGISAGPIDGAAGENMKRALLAYQIHSGLPVSGELDAETRAALLVEEPLFIQYMISEEDLNRLMKVPDSWLAKSKVDRLDYETILELVAEKGRASQPFIRKLNPQINWTNITPGILVKIPRIDPPAPVRAAFARVHLYSKTLNVFGKSTNLIAHFPCSIAAKVEKRPVGQLFVDKAAANPTYLFNPEVFSESAEAKKIGRKLTIPAGPNNPVGTAWIGLSRSGYGIHGTPKPEQVGRTESHGCFRLANWNAEHLLQMSWAGMPVFVEP
jgi:peptidoglycan hydrolase-like protein with peptidoglycan-binding domain